ncbi:MAG TPA: PhzF family phenazine biosynthesis protein [Solirubrobacteraceae bacterium]|jgi:predicted PhzF superfamily epimerase YddE/YHI9|nr:PhzF family phenazine biosynthesis protein [Solirubrobacteraceae bacterium]
MPELQVLRVFVAADGGAGNPLGLFVAAGEAPTAARQATAARLGYSETVFVHDRASGALTIHTPLVELPFAGHPLVGTAWALEELDVLRPPAGQVPVRREGACAFIEADPAQTPAWDLIELEGVGEVRSLDAPPNGSGHACCWAPSSGARGELYARVFAPDYGVPEDPATGSAAVALCAALGRELRIVQGAGSELHARPLPSGRVELSGRVVLDERRPERIG